MADFAQIVLFVLGVEELLPASELELTGAGGFANGGDG